MISVDKGHIVIEGNGLDIMTDVTVILNNLFELLQEEYGEDTAKEMIRHSVELAFMSKQELDEMANKKLSEMTLEEYLYFMGVKVDGK